MSLGFENLNKSQAERFERELVIINAIAADVKSNLAKSETISTQTAKANVEATTKASEAVKSAADVVAKKPNVFVEKRTTEVLTLTQDQSRAREKQKEAWDDYKKKKAISDAEWLRYKAEKKTKRAQ